jgi:hypothetical protein
MRTKKSKWRYACTYVCIVHGGANELQRRTELCAPWVSSGLFSVLAFLLTLFLSLVVKKYVIFDSENKIYECRVNNTMKDWPNKGTVEIKD